MSTVEPGRRDRAADPYASGTAGRDHAYEEEHGAGWVLFSGVMLSMIGTLNVIWGIAAVSNSTFFTQNATYILSGLNTWGWVLIAMGTVQVLTAFGVWAQVSGVRWLAVLIAGTNAIVQLMAIDAYPFWSLTIFTLDVLVIYGLVTYGARPSTN
jgi:hypothetical protein